MIYSEIELAKMMKAGDMSIEDQVKASILGFIHCIYLNKQDFIKAVYETEYYGKLPMTFRKKAGQVMGVITAKVNGKEQTYIFNQYGYEPLEDLLQ